jgi:hypothetical protein
MQTLVTLVMVPLMLLNAFGGLVSGIWLAILGEWWALGYGLLGLFSPFFLAIILMPGFIFLAPAGILFEKQRPLLAFPLLLFGNAYTYAIITVWCILVFYVFMHRADANTFWPLLIWSFGVALGPWTYMAQKEEQGGNGEASAMTVVFAQVAYVIMSLVLIFGRPALFDLAMAFGAVMFLGLIIQVVVALALWREQRSLGSV